MKKNVPIPELQSMEKTRDTRYLKNYTLNYINSAGKEKIYEIVSCQDIPSMEEIGATATGVIIVGYKEDKLLLCKEFRLGINDFVYNMPAGRFDALEEDVETCARRELFEETGHHITEIIEILPPAYAAPDISDASAWLVVCKVDGSFDDAVMEPNEWIKADLFTKEQLKEMLKTEKFSGRAQTFAWFFANS